MRMLEMVTPSAVAAVHHFDVYASDDSCYSLEWDRL